MNANQKVKQFIRKLKRYQQPKRMEKGIEEEEKGLEQSAQQFDAIEKESKAQSIYHGIYSE
jgi:cell fate (sporulation/competence/biofilm development) regulator YmcA (YheA/YmcA/DUF963 family)